jgi:hypothetical protein
MTSGQDHAVKLDPERPGRAQRVHPDVRVARVVSSTVWPASTARTRRGTGCTWLTGVIIAG